MAQLLVRNLEPDVKARLRRRAQRHKRSMEQEAREILRAALKDESSAKKKALSEQLREIFEEIGLGPNEEISELRHEEVRPIRFKR
jgi:plasmid stability protein